MIKWNYDGKKILRRSALSVDLPSHHLLEPSKSREVCSKLWGILISAIENVLSQGIEEGPISIAIEFWLENGTFYIVPRVDRELFTLGVYCKTIHELYDAIPVNDDPHDDAFDVKTQEMIDVIARSLINGLNESHRKRMVASFGARQISFIYRNADDAATESNPVVISGDGL